MDSKEKQLCQLKFVHNVVNNESYVFYDKVDDIEKVVKEKMKRAKYNQKQHELMEKEKKSNQKNDDGSKELTNFSYQSYKWNGEDQKKTSNKMLLLNFTFARAICIHAGLTSLFATSILVAGFINMGSFKVTEAESCVGIWCGFLMYAQVFVGLLVMASRHMSVGITYVVLSLLCVAINIYGIIESIDYYNEFKDFVEHFKNDKCTSFTNMCSCGSLQFDTLQGFEVEHCSMFKFGEELWLGILILAAACALCAVIAAIMGIAGLLLTFVKRNDNDLENKKRATYYPAM